MQAHCTGVGLVMPREEQTLFFVCLLEGEGSRRR